MGKALFKRFHPLKYSTKGVEQTPKTYLPEIAGVLSFVDEGVVCLTITPPAFLLWHHSLFFPESCQKRGT